jgi:hypothetical protein
MAYQKDEGDEQNKTKKMSIVSRHKVQTLDQILGMIEQDAVINEDKHESQDGSSGDDDDEVNDEDYLDANDMKILRDRILQAIEIFSKWNPNRKKELLMFVLPTVSYKLSFQPSAVMSCTAENSDSRKLLKL